MGDSSLESQVELTEVSEMLKISQSLRFSNKKSYAPRGFWPVGRKYKAHFFNRVVSMGGSHEFNYGLPTGYSDNLYGALSTSKPDWRYEHMESSTPLTREQVVNAKKRQDMGEKIINYITAMNDAKNKFDYLEAETQKTEVQNEKQIRRK